MGPPFEKSKPFKMIAPPFIGHGQIRSGSIKYKRLGFLHHICVLYILRLTTGPTLIGVKIGSISYKKKAFTLSGLEF